jgi:hypothetical protein
MRAMRRRARKPFTNLVLTIILTHRKVGGFTPIHPMGQATVFNFSSAALGMQSLFGNHRLDRTPKLPQLQPPAPVRSFQTKATAKEIANANRPSRKGPSARPTLLGQPSPVTVQHKNPWAGVERGVTSSVVS